MNNNNNNDMLLYIVWRSSSNTNSCWRLQRWSVRHCITIYISHIMYPQSGRQIMMLTQEDRVANHFIGYLLCHARTLITAEFPFAWILCVKCTQPIRTLQSCTPILSQIGKLSIQHHTRGREHSSYSELRISHCTTPHAWEGALVVFWTTHNLKHSGNWTE